MHVCACVCVCAHVRVYVCMCECVLCVCNSTFVHVYACVAMCEYVHSQKEGREGSNVPLVVSLFLLKAECRPNLRDDPLSHQRIRP